MAIAPMTENLNIISALPDEPNDVGGLTASQLKAKFDQAGNVIQEYLNHSLIPQLDAAHLPMEAAQPEGPTLKDTIEGIALGQIPNGSLTEEKLAPELAADIAGKADASQVFTREETLSEETATLYGLGTEAVPDQVFQKLEEAQYKIGDIRTTVKTDLGDHWLLCNGDVILPHHYPGLSPFLPKMRNKASKLISHTYVGSVINTGSTNTAKVLNGKILFLGSIQMTGNTTMPGLVFGNASSWGSSLSAVMTNSSQYASLTYASYYGGYYYLSGGSGGYYSKVYTPNFVTFSSINTSGVVLRGITSDGSKILLLDYNNGGNYRIYYGTSPTSLSAASNYISLPGDVSFASGMEYLNGTTFIVLAYSKPRIMYSTSPTTTSWSDKILDGSMTVGTQNEYHPFIVNGYACIPFYSSANGSTEMHLYYTQDISGTWQKSVISGVSAVQSVSYDGAYYILSAHDKTFIATALAGPWTDITNATESLSYLLYVPDKGYVGLAAGQAGYIHKEAELVSLKLPTIATDSAYHYIKAKEAE